MHPRTHYSYAAFYSSKFILLGVQLPFFSGWLALNGFGAAEIGWITGAALILRLLFGPFVAFWADHQDDERRALRAIALLFALSALALNAPLAKPAIAFSSVALLWCFGLLVPLTDSAVLRADRAGLANYGQARAIGSFAFLSTTILAGQALTVWGLSEAVKLMAVPASATLLFGLGLPKNPAPVSGRSALSWRHARRLLSEKIFLLALFAAGLVQGSHAFYYAFSILDWTAIGYSPLTIGELWATGVAVEILLLTQMRGLARRLAPATLIALGAAAAVVRWPLTALHPALPLLFLVQTLHALTFAATYVGTIEFIDRAAPKRLVNTAMTITSTAGVGAMTGAATVAAGYVFDAAGAAAGYYMMAAMSACGFILALTLAKTWRCQQLFE